MKKVLLISSLIAVSLTASAQTVLKNALAESIIPTAKEVMFNERTTAPAFIKLKTDAQIPHTQFLAWAKTNLKMRNADGLVLIKTNKDQIGYTHYRYQQTFNGILVEYATYIAHTKNGKVVSVNGDYNQGIVPDNMLILTEGATKLAALQHHGVKQLMMEIPGYIEMLRKDMNDATLDFTPKGELVILPKGDGAQRIFKYAYKFDIFSAEPYGRWETYVDAATGEVLAANTLIHTDDAVGIAKTKYSGERQIRTDSLAPGQYRLYESNHIYTDTAGQIAQSGVMIETKNAKNQNGVGAAVDFLDTDNYWNNVNSDFDEVATDAHWGAEQTYDYFKNEHDRNSYNNQGSKMMSYVHIQSKSYCNASWNGLYMVYGDCNGKALTSVDVCGHEMAHGVTGNTARLIYQRESGGLNESFSDVFGNSIEFFAKPDQFDWRVGDNTNALRSMSNPNLFLNPDTYKGKYWRDASSECIPGEGNDNCGVHTNSGVQNFWYYLLSMGGTGTNDNGDAYDVAAIGISKAGKIAYRNLDVYLTQSSNYSDAAFFGAQSALELFGNNSPELASTINAWYAVGLGKKYTEIPVSDFSIDKVLCQPNSTIKFVNESGSAFAFEWDFGDGEKSTTRNPSHQYEKEGKYTVTLIAANDNGADTILKKDVVQIFAGNAKDAVCTPEVSSPQGSAGVINFSLNDINNASKGANGDQYQDFTCIRTNLSVGQTYPIALSTVTGIQQYTRVWIDYNNDGTFATDELVFGTDTVKGTNHAGSIVIPATAVTGTPLRLRAIASRTSGNIPNDPCAKVRYGQIEEYSLVLTGTSAVTANSALQALQVYPNPANDIVTLTYAADANQKSTVQLLNALGELVYAEQFTGAVNQSVNVAAFAKGVYYLKVMTGNEQNIQKVVLQ